MRRSVLLASAGILLAGCAYGPFHRHRNDINDGTGFGRKLVVEKRPKSVLVAYDATVCMVDEKRFKEVHLRDDVWCNWRREGGGKSVAATPGGLSGSVAEPLAAGAKNPVRRTVRPKPPKSTADAKPRTAKKKGD